MTLTFATMARMSAPHRVPLSLLAFGVLPMLLAGCATPLGPRYDLRRETITVRYVDRPVAAAIDYSLRATVQNTGNRPLDMVRIRTSQRIQQDTGLGDAHAGQTSANRSGVSLRGGWMRVRVDPPIGYRESREIQVSYIAPIRRGAILIEPQEWFPSFLPPRGLFAQGEPRAKKTEIHIYAPSGDRVLTTGRLRFVHSGSGGATTEYGYEIRANDFPPFLLIGKYQEQKVVIRRRAVILWTPEPTGSACARILAGEAVSAAEFYRSNFGPIGTARQPLRLIQIPGDSSSSPSGSAEATESIPFGVLFSQAAGEACRQPERFYYPAAKGLAATWFGWAVRPEAGAEAIIGGAQDYAALLAVGQQYGVRARRQQVNDWVAEYNRLRSRTRPLPPGNVDARASLAQDRMAELQSALLFVGLEDRFGSDPMKRGLRILVGSLRGSDAGRNELRSALEQETGVDLYPIFNQWLGRPGIPAPVLERYNEATSQSNLNTDVSSRSRREQ